MSSSIAAAIRSGCTVRVRSAPATTGRTGRQHVDRLEDGRLVLLQILVVGRGQSFEGRQQAGQVPDQGARLGRGSARADRDSSSAASGWSRWRRRRPARRSRTRASRTGSRASASRLRWTPMRAAANRNSAAKSRSETASRLLGQGAIEAEVVGQRLPVDGEGACRPGRPSPAEAATCAGAAGAAAAGRAASGQKCDSHQWPSVIGWARWRWV